MKKFSLKCISLVCCFIIFLLALGCTADVKQTLNEGQQMVQPVVNALKDYYSKHGVYPKDLDTLVVDKYIKEVPILPKKSGTVGVWQLSYQVSPDKSFYYLHFSYDFPNAIAPPDLFTCYIISYKPEWKIKSYPPIFQTLVAQYVGRRFQETGSPNALKIAIEALIKRRKGKSGKCINLSRAFVIHCLGKGKKVDLSKMITEPNNLGEVYLTKDKKIKYCFVYMKKDKLPPYGYFLRDLHVVSAIYVIQTNKLGQNNWSLIEKCY